MLISLRSKSSKALRVAKVYIFAEIRIAREACVDRTAMQKHESALYIYITNIMASMHVTASFLLNIVIYGSLLALTKRDSSSCSTSRIFGKGSAVNYSVVSSKMTASCQTNV